MRIELAKFWVLLLLVLTGCASSRPSSSGRATVDYNSYTENLAAVRPVYTSVSTPVVKSPPVVSPPPRKEETRKSTTPAEVMNVNKSLDLVLDTLANQNRSIRYAPGFRIQIYVGTQRQDVDAAKLLIYQNFPELSPYLSYNQPTYKLKVGDFMRRTDAERYYSAIRRLLSSAQLQSDKVDIRRSLLIK